MCKLSATELFIIKNQIERIDAYIKLWKYKLSDYRKQESTLISKIKKVKELLNEEKRKIDLGSQKLKDEMGNLFEEQSTISKEVVAVDKNLKNKEYERTKLDLKFKLYDNQSERRDSLISYMPKENLKSIDNLNTDNIQGGKKSISYQYPTTTRSHHKKCFSPSGITQVNRSIKEVSQKTSKDDNIDRNSTPLKRPLNKNRRKTTGFIDLNPKVTPIKQSSIENRLKQQKKNSNLKSSPETNLNIKSNSKQPKKIDSKTSKSSSACSFNSNTSTPQRKNVCIDKSTLKNHIKPKTYVLTNTNSTALKNTGDSVPKTDNIRFENKPDKINDCIHKFGENNEIQDVNLSKESDSPLVYELPEKLILKDDIKSVKDSALDESYNLIEFTTQEKITETDSSKTSKNDNVNCGDLKNVDILDELDKLELNHQSTDCNNKKSEMPVFVQKETLRSKKHVPCSQTSETEIMHDFSIFDKTELVDDSKDINLTILGNDNDNEKVNEIKEEDSKAKSEHINDEPSSEDNISNNNLNTKDINNNKAINSSNSDLNPVKVIPDNNNYSSEQSNIIEIKNDLILNSEPLESFNPEIKNEKLIDIKPSDSKSSNHGFKIICTIIILSVVGIVALSILIYKQKLFVFFK